MKRREVGNIEIYADILFLVNFSMDFLTLYLTGRVSGKRLRRRNLLLSAAVGGGVGTMLLVCRMPERLTVPAGLLLSLLLTRIAFGSYRQFARLLRDSIIVWGAGALLGGIMTFVMSLGNPVPSAAPASDFPEAFALCFGIALLLARLFRTSRGRRSASVTIEAKGIRMTLEALCDSGSFAAEPMTGLPVIPVRREALGHLADLCEQQDCPLKLRLIPLSGIGGERLLRGFVPDRLIVDDAETEAVVAVYDGSRFAGYDALLPAVLCGGGGKRTANRREYHEMKKTEETSCSSEHPC